MYINDKAGMALLILSKINNFITRNITRDNRDISYDKRVKSVHQGIGAGHIA